MEARQEYLEKKKYEVPYCTSVCMVFQIYSDVLL